MSADTKICPHCHVRLPLSAFHVNRRVTGPNAGTERLHSWCKGCVRELARKNYWRNRDIKRRQMRAWHDRNIEHVKEYTKARYRRNHIRMRTKQLNSRGARISEQEVEKALKTTFACEICERSFIDASPHIDHDHATGEFRGILCGRCNQGLGLFRDNPASLRRAAQFIERTSKTVSVEEETGKTMETIQ